MRRGTTLIFISAMILIVVFCLMAQSLVIVQRLASVEKMHGTVEVNRGGRSKFKALPADGVIKTGDVVRTGAGSQAEFKWLDGTRWKVMENTTITVKKAVKNTLRHADYSELGLTSGKVFIRIMKALTAASRFEVETPTAVAAVRGTIFSVEVKDGKTEVAVFKGKVQVRSGEQSAGKLIEPGQAALSSQPGTLETTKSTSADAAFAKESSIVLPDLSTVKVKVTENGRHRVTGFTEANDKVTINGISARVRGDGYFDKKITLKPGEKTITIITTDPHSVTNTVVKSVDNPIPAPADSGSAAKSSAPTGSAALVAPSGTPIAIPPSGNTVCPTPAAP